jgi:hypothetical protein
MGLIWIKPNPPPRAAIATHSSGWPEVSMAETEKLSVEKALGKIREADERKAKAERMSEKTSELDEEIARMRAQRLRLEGLQRRSKKPD